MRPPRKWNLPLTYRPKIARVASGEIRQTIRPGLKYTVGDWVAVHGWEGRPYRSRWTGRTPYFELKKVIDIVLFPEGIGNQWICLIPWGDRAADELAQRDGIDPPTGQELGRVLMEMHDLPDDGMDFQVLRW